MRMVKRNGLAVNLICMLFLCASGVFADYIEGIDTTDVNGYGLDSAFKVTNGLISGQNIVIYHMDGSMNGYFNYSFDDIKMAADTIKYIFVNGSTIAIRGSTQQIQIGNYCFVIKKFKDSTYSKVQILNNLTNNRYVFKYGTNTSQNNRMLEKCPYDSSVRYKPNNFNNNYQYYCYYPNGAEYLCGRNIASWEPPLPNNNHFLGYRYYMSKPGVNIDTTAPINMAQWDSVFFTTLTTFSGSTSGYFNLVAVYSEGESDFLQGWQKRTSSGADGIISPAAPLDKFHKNLEIKKTSDGFFISFQTYQNKSGSASLSIYNVTGTKVAGFSNIKGNKVFWKTIGRNLAEGQYIVKLELPDKRVLGGKLVYSK